MLLRQGIHQILKHMTLEGNVIEHFVRTGLKQALIDNVKINRNHIKTLLFGSIDNVTIANVLLQENKIYWTALDITCKGILLFKWSFIGN